MATIFRRSLRNRCAFGPCGEIVCQGPISLRFFLQCRSIGLSTSCATQVNDPLFANMLISFPALAALTTGKQLLYSIIIALVAPFCKPSSAIESSEASAPHEFFEVPVSMAGGRILLASDVQLVDAEV